MEIERLKDTKGLKRIGQLSRGKECFSLDDGSIFLPTDEYRHSCRERGCVSLRTGIFRWLSSDKLVKPLRFKAVEIE